MKKNTDLVTRLLLVPFLLLISIGMLNAQSGGSGISGFVFDESSKPIDGATVAVKNTATGFSATTVSDKKGYFTLRDLPVGVYTVEISAVGAQSTIIKDNVLNLGDRLVLHKVTLSKSATTLQEVTVRSNSFNNSVDRLGTGTAVTGATLRKIPIATRNYTDLMMLSPLANGASLAGAKQSGTGYMLDGVSNRRAHFSGITDAAFSISSEVIREFEISTNSYDVTNGRGSGGLVKAITKSGTNKFSGSAWGYYGSNDLAQHTDPNGHHQSPLNDVGQWGGLFSGPLIKDKLFFIVSYDQYENKRPFSAFDYNLAGSTQVAAEKALKVPKAAIDSVVNWMYQNGFPKMPQYGTIGITQKTQNAFVKLDYNLNKKNLLTLKYNFLRFEDPNKLKGNGLLSTQYVGVEYQNGVMLGLRTEFSPKLVNELKVNFSTYRKFLHFVGNHVPEGFVTITTPFVDGSANKNNYQLAFGDQNWVPERDASDVVQIVDYLRYKVGNLNFVFGTDNSFNHITDRLSHDQQGQFYYNSLSDLYNNNPYRFNRKISLTGDNPKISVPLIELGAFAQMETNIRPNINLTVGLRWDGQIIGSAPTYNPQLERELGVNTHVVPFDAKNIQPRVNLIWDVKGNGQDIVKFGAGLFASEITTQPITFAHIDNGVDFRQVDIYTNVPKPDWAAYQKDFNQVPGLDYYKTLNNTQPATVLAIDKHLKNPLTFKTNLSYYHYFNSWFRMGANIYFDNTWDNFYLKDLNLKKTASFVTNEGREIYVDPSVLTPDKYNKGNSYSIPLAASRQFADFNQVRYFTNASWSSNFIGAMIEAAFQIGKDGSFSISYARGAAKGTPPYDNGDPRNSNFFVGPSYYTYGSYGKSWYSDGDQKHKLVALLLSPSFYGFTISSSFQAWQGNRYSMIVNNDIIGENNNGTDLAYIYNPSDPNTPANIRTGMQTLLQTTSPSFRKYLTDNFGKFAPYNGGIMPWRTQWNLSAAYDWKITGTHKLTLRCDIFNVLNLLSYKWGGYTNITNTNLYNVNGFDQATHSFTYDVNPSAGAPQAASGVFYTVQFGARYSF